MRNTAASENDTWHSKADQTKRSYVSLALEGLRARHYVGVFHRISSAKHPTYLAAIKLDGFERSLEVKFTYLARSEDHFDIKGMLSGLRVFKTARRFAFTRTSKGPHVFQGTLDLPGARLIISVLPTLSADETSVLICHIEVVRDHE